MLKQKIFNEKGIYSVTTNFMLIVILVVSFLFLISFGAESFSRQKEFSESSDYLKESFSLKEQVVLCTGKLTHEKLNEFEEDVCLNEKIKGFKIESLDFFDCKKEEWFFGENDSCNKKISFYLNIYEKKTCLGRIILCI